MFKCAITNRITGSREPMNKIVVETREQSYSNGLTESKGWEIVKEITVSNKGLELWKLMTDEQKTSLIKDLSRHK